MNVLTKTHEMKARHVFLKGVNGWGIFYQLQDAILYYTMYSVLVRELNIPILSFSIMFNHTHSLTGSVPRGLTGKFQRRLEISFALRYNKEHNRKGKLFMDSFGCSEKTNTKQVMGCAAYVANNSVAGHLYKSARDDRWTMLAYYDNPHPFSEPIVRSKCRPAMKRALTLVDACRKNEAVLNYAVQRNIFAKLNKTERTQITDYILYRYRFLDYDGLIALYGSFSNVIAAMETNAGAEYEIKDEYGDHSCYRTMLRLVKDLGYKDYCFENLSPEELSGLAETLRRKTGANMTCIRKFLHLRQPPR